MSDFGDTGELVPDLPAPIRAYRSWSPSGLKLTGNGGAIWPIGRPLEARCSNFHGSPMWMSFYRGTERPTKHDHPIPSPTAKGHNGFGCGIYAYKTYAQAREHGSGVVGCVELGGRVYEHENGYRAQFGMIVALYCFTYSYDEDDDDPTLERLAQVYDVPVEEPPFYDEIGSIRERVNAEADKQATEWDRLRAEALTAPNEPERETDLSKYLTSIQWPAYTPSVSWGRPAASNPDPSETARRLGLILPKQLGEADG